MSPEIIGGVGVTITGDYSDLQKAFDEAQSAAQKAGTDIAESLTAGFSSADASASSLAAAMKPLEDQGYSAAEALAKVQAAGQEAGSGLDEAGSAAQDANSQLSLFGDTMDTIPWADAAGQLNMFTGELEPFAGAADQAGKALEDTNQQLQEVGSTSEKSASMAGEFLTALLEFSGIAVSIEAMRELVSTAIELSGQIEKSRISLTALSGDATASAEKIDQLERLANQFGVSFESLLTIQQRFVAFGITLQQSDGAMHAVLETAAALNSNVEEVANRLDRISLSGMASARQLQQLGLSTDDLARAMGVASGEVATAFKNLDQEQRLEVLEAALKKFDGTAEAVAQSFVGQWQTAKNDINQALAAIGDIFKEAALGWIGIFKSAGAGIQYVLDHIPGAQAKIKEEIQGLLPEVEALSSRFEGQRGKLADLVAAYNNGDTSARTFLTQLQGLKDNLQGLADAQDSHRAATVQDTSVLNLLGAAVFDASQHLVTLKSGYKGTAEETKALTGAYQEVLKATADYKSAQADATANAQRHTDILSLLVAQVAVERSNVASATLAYQEHLGTAQQVESAKHSLYDATTKLADAQLEAKNRTTDYTNALDASRYELQQAQQNVDLLAKAHQQGLVPLSALVDAQNKLTTATENYALASVRAAAQVDPFGIKILGQNQNVKLLAESLTEAEVNLAKVRAEFDAGRVSGDDYASAMKRVADAADALHVAQAAAAAAGAGQTDKLSLLNVQLAMAQAKLEDLDKEYQTNATLAPQVAAAQDSVARLTKEVADAMGMGTEKTRENSGALGDHQAAHQKLKGSIDDTYSSLDQFLGMEAKVPDAAHAASAAIRDQAASYDELTMAAFKAADAAKQVVTDVDAAGKAISSISLGQLPTGMTWRPAGNPMMAGTPLYGTSLTTLPGYMIDPETGSAITVDAYIQKIVDQFSKGIISQGQAVQTLQGLGVADVNKALGIGGGGGTSAVGTSAPGPVSTGAGGMMYVDEVQNGFLYNQLAEVITVLTASSNALSAVAGNSAQTADAVTSAAQAMTTAANVVSSSTSASMTSELGLTGGLGAIALAITNLQNSTNEQKVAMTGLPSSTAAAAQTAAQNIAQQVSSTGMYTNFGLPHNYWMPTPGTMVSDSSMVPPTSGPQQTFNLDFSGANLGGMTPASIRQAFVEALRLSGARF